MHIHVTSTRPTHIINIYTFATFWLAGWLAPCSIYTPLDRSASAIHIPSSTSKQEQTLAISTSS